MNSFRRWTTSLTQKFDQLRHQVESHEALAADALAEMKKSLSDGHEELERIQKDCAHLKQELRAARAAAGQWLERAQREQDDKRAVECLRRRRTAQLCEMEVRERLEEQQSAKTRVRRLLSELEREFMEVRQSRELNASVNSAPKSLERHSSSLPPASFSPWATGSEDEEASTTYTSLPPDSFAESYFRKEEEEALVEELAALRHCGGSSLHS